MYRISSDGSRRLRALGSVVVSIMQNIAAGSGVLAGLRENGLRPHDSVGACETVGSG